MKWTKHPEPKHGDVRVRRGFLWFPQTIGGETRWLEVATWEEKLDAETDPFPPWWRVRMARGANSGWWAMWCRLRV